MEFHSKRDFEKYLIGNECCRNIHVIPYKNMEFHVTSKIENGQPETVELKLWVFQLFRAIGIIEMGSLQVG